MPILAIFANLVPFADEGPSVIAFVSVMAFWWLKPRKSDVVIDSESQLICKDSYVGSQARWIGWCQALDDDDDDVDDDVDDVYVVPAVAGLNKGHL